MELHKHDEEKLSVTSEVKEDFLSEEENTDFQRPTNEDLRSLVRVADNLP